MAVKIIKLFLRIIKFLVKELIIIAIVIVISFHIVHNIKEPFKDEGATSISVLIGERKLLSSAEKYYSADEVEITGESHYSISVVSAVCGKRLGYDTGQYKFAIATLVIPFIRGCAITDFDAKPKPTCHIVWLASSEKTKRHEIKHCLGYAHTGKN